MNPDLAVAIDLGGTRLKAGVVEVGTGALLASLPPQHSPDSWADARMQVETAAGAMRESHPSALGFGMAMPGVIDQGLIISLPGKLTGAEGFDVGGWARRLAGEAPVAVVNDATAAAVGEAMAGAGAAHPRVVVFTLGTGVGVGVVEHGRPLGSGPLGGGILGGQILLPGQAGLPPDTAGAHDTIEARCCAGALVSRAQAGGGRWTSAAQVLAAAGEGDSSALAAVEQHRDDLALAVVALAFAHAPGAVVIGGGMAASSLLFDGLAEAVGRRLTFGLEVDVLPAALGDDAALAGLGVLLGGHRASL